MEKEKKVLTEAEMDKGIANIKAVWGIEGMTFSAEEEADLRAIMRGEKKAEDFLIKKSN